MNKILIASIIAFLIISTTSCKSTKRTTVNNQTNKRQRPNGNGQRRTPAQIIAQMDTNNDGRLSSNEVKGPLKNNFNVIDTNRDGYLTKSEIAAAPQPQRKGPRRN